MVGADAETLEFLAHFLALGNRIALLECLLPQVSFFSPISPSIHCGC